MEDRYESIHGTVSMENCTYAAAPSVKSDQKLVFGGLGTGFNMTKAGWVVKTLANIFFLFVLPFILSFFLLLEYNPSMTTALAQTCSFFPGSDSTVSFKRTSARPTIPNLLNSINGAKMDHWLQVT